ncbi:alpha/beta hydrolase [Oceanobacillus chungangensis]|uniref:Esterase n=1 Tax=Oceanobacillus chungangensis TaxID=1229152 RepID=A0A3D8PXB3_9BACI|nr:alpha/beta hydrolase-fold protein [Oceanobacillus chungangensis]RDW20664.1 hypothetical protein CWR45_05400 [Oceanobacillus chungangensis]
MNLIKKRITSNYCNREFEVHLLSAANEFKEEADILYVQDGGDYLELGEFEEAFKELSIQYPEQARNLIAVLISPGTSEERWQSYNRKGEEFDNYLFFFTEELMPKLEAEFNAKIVKRGLLGDSLGANISLNIAMRNPEIWTHLLLQSAAVSKEDLQELRKKEKLHWNVYQTVGIFEDEFVSTISNERLYITTLNKEMYCIFKDKQVNIKYVEKEEHHLWDFWRRNLPEALDFFAAGQYENIPDEHNCN